MLSKMSVFHSFKDVRNLHLHPESVTSPKHSAACRGLAVRVSVPPAVRVPLPGCGGDSGLCCVGVAVFGAALQSRGELKVQKSCGK